MSRRHMPYLQLWKGRYRVRAPIREDRRKHFGGRPYFIKALGTADQREAEQRAIPVLAEFQRQCRLADEGGWPPDGPDQTRQIAIAYGGSETPEDAVQAKDGLAANRTRLRAALAAFLSRPFFAGHSVAEALADLGIYPEVQTKPMAFPSPPSEPYPFDTLITAWALERHVRPRSKADAKTAAGRFKQFIGHDDARRVTKADANGWKNALVKAGTSPGLIRKYRDYMNMLLNYAVENETVTGITANPMTGFVYRTKVKRSVKIAGMTRGVRRGFKDEEARLILLAARHEKQPHLRWIPWLLCFLGARLEEVCGAMAADIVQIAGIWCFHIRIVLRDEGTSIKNDFSLRVVPLHPALLAEGFLEYVHSLPENGPLFPQLKPDLYGSRAGTATKRISRWVRQKVGIIDPDIAPNHSFRHRFETIANRRQYAIPPRTINAILGHSDKGMEFQYGEHEIREMHEAISKLPSPA